jgi:hypothetical protein
MSEYDVNIFKMYLQGFANNIHIGMFINDAIIISVTTFSENKHNDSPHNLYMDETSINYVTNYITMQNNNANNYIEINSDTDIEMRSIR